MISAFDPSAPEPEAMSLASGELAAREERFRLITQATRDGLYDWNLATNLTWRNEAYQALYSPNEPVGADETWWEEHIHPDDRARVLTSIRAAFHGSSDIWTEEYRFRRCTGEYSRVFDRAYILRDGAGKPLRMVGAIADVTAERELEEQLKDAFAHLQESAAALVEQNRRLAEEVAERRRAEADLRALSTPIIHLWDRVLTLPVIGAVDEERAGQMMDRLLQEIAASRALFAILDLTGVEMVDGATADHLLKIVRAVSLLGSRCVVSGVSPRIAQTLVTLHLATDGLTTFGTLQDALRYVLGQAGITQVATPRR